MIITDWPETASLEDYSSAVEKTVNYYSAFNDVLAVYTFGGISSPGISDIDLLLVITPDFNDPYDGFRRILSRKENYLFSHAPFLVYESDFYFALSQGYYSNLRIQFSRTETLSGSFEGKISKASVSHFLMRYYIFALETRNTGLLKLRSFLLLSKALKFDYNYLNVRHKRFEDDLKAIEGFRRDVFSLPKEEIILLAARFMDSFIDWYTVVLQQNKFYVSNCEHIVTLNGYQLVSSSGLKSSLIDFGCLSSFLYVIFDKRTINLIRRLNRGKKIFVPMSVFDEKDRSKFHRLCQIKSRLELRYKGYIPLVQLLNI